MKEFKPEIFWLDPSELTPYANNSKKHTTEQLDEIAGQISRFGFDQPIVVDKQRVIIKGHGRREAAIRLRLKAVPVIFQDLSEHEAMAARIADNKVASKTGFDMDKLAFDMGTLERNKFDLKFTGFDKDEIKKMIDAVPENIRDPGKVSGNSESESNGEPQPVKVIEPADETMPEVKKTSIRIGTVIELGHHTLVCGDSTNAELVKVHAPKPDMVYTDPPYGISVVQGGKIGGEKPFGSIGGGKACKPGVYAPIIGDDTTDTATNAFEVVRSLGAKIQIWWGGNYYAHKLPPSKRWIVWDKNTTGNFSDCELAWTNMDGAIRKFEHTWNGMIKDSERGEKRVHPTQKPVALAEWCIAEFAADSSIILDLFAGSGSTLLAAERLGKTCVAFELSPEYCEAICLRWEKLTGEKRKIVSL